MGGAVVGGAVVGGAVVGGGAIGAHAVSANNATTLITVRNEIRNRNSLIIVVLVVHEIGTSRQR